MNIRFVFLIVFIQLLLLRTYSFAGSKSTSQPDTSSQIAGNKISIKIENIQELEELFKKKDPNWFAQYGTLVIALTALVGTVATNILSNRRSRINAENQLKSNNENLTTQLQATEKNILTQINNTNSLESEKRKAELLSKQNEELKNSVAKFIREASELNKKLDFIIYSELEEGRIEEAEAGYSETKSLRNNLTNVYYSIKVGLDGSQKHKDLEKIIDSYMGTTCFKFNLSDTKSDDYEQPIAKLYHKVKTIIHDNYVEPV